MGRLLGFRRREQPRANLDGPSPEVLRVVTIQIAQQAMSEVTRLQRGQRLIIERHTDDRTPFTITVERMDAEEATP